MRITKRSFSAISLLCALEILLSLPVIAQEPAFKLKLTPSTIPAGRSRVIRIVSESGADLTGFELQKPAEDSGVLIAPPGPELVDGKKAILARLTVDQDADEQVMPLTVVKKKDGKVVETYTVDLTISAFSAKVMQKKPVPSGMKYEVDGMFQPMSYQATKDVFGRKVGNHYYAVVISLGNNTGFDLQVNKIGFITARTIKVADVDADGKPVFDSSGNVKMRNDLLEITAIDRSLVRSSIEKDQNFGVRALAMNLIGGVGTLSTGFLPFFHALGPRANFSSFTSVLNGNLKDGFSLAVPDLTIRHLNRLDNSLVMDQDFVLPNNSERNTVVFIPRKALGLEQKSDSECKQQKASAECKDQRDNLLKVKETLGRLVIVGRQIERFENRQIVVRSDRPSFEPEPFANEPTVPKQGSVTLEGVTPDAGTLSDSTEVIITGSGFIPGTPVKVIFGNRQTTGVALTSTEVKATVPPSGKAEVIDVKAIAGDQPAELKKAYSYVDELKIDKVDPITGPAAGKTVVKITGKGFLSGASVTFGNTPAEVVSISNDHTVITVTLPAQAAGTVDVTVKNKNGAPVKAPKPFTYSP